MPVSQLEQLGFHPTGGSVHLSRTMMFDELVLIMDRLARNPSGDLKKAVLEENLLGKPTSTTRQITFSKLSRLYGLDVRVPLFRFFFELWGKDKTSRALLASLVAQARDPVFASSWGLISKLSPGSSLAAETIEVFLSDTYGDHLRLSTRRSASRSLRSSWTQCGYLTGTTDRVRTRPTPTPECLALALWMAKAEGRQDQRLLESLWVERLELDMSSKEDMLQSARQRGYVEYKNAGGIMELKVVLDV